MNGVVPAAQGASQHPIEVRRLELADVDEFWRLRLRALRDHPDAFGSDYEEARARVLGDVRRDFAARNLAPESVVLGAFDPTMGAGTLVGTIGCFREQGA